MSDLLSLQDVTAGDVNRLLRSAAQLKRAPRLRRHLAGKMLALVFQKPSTRTRVSFEVGIYQLGGQATYLGPDDIQLGVREEVRDVARTLSRYVDGIVMRTFKQSQVEEMAQFASVPVINGLSDQEHPCQALSDLFTMQERFRKLSGLTVGYIGDGNNVLNSLLEGCSLLGAHVQFAAPNGYQPSSKTVRFAMLQGQRSRARVRRVTEPEAAARGADVLYTDVWTSMGQEGEQRARRQAFRGFQLNERLLRLAKPRCVVMHCLPAHRGEEIT
ncbi:MAG: ornithine carbamoyltransferase, partial [Candidatus Omnitrophica bacterium]|nr:ornithine carbamoyltransferase [Candidatus Omnitrophota bacterium]